MSTISAPEKPEMQFSYQAVIPDGDRPRFVAFPVDGGWTLPVFTAGERPSDNRLARFARAIGEQLGLHVTPLRSLYSQSEYDVQRRFDATYLMEVHTADWTPPSPARWVGREVLDALQLPGPKHRAGLEAWLAEAERG